MDDIKFHNLWLDSFVMNNSYNKFYDERKNLPQWAKDEKIYNCSLYHEDKHIKEFIAKFNKAEKKLNKKLAEMLRKLADILDSEDKLAA